MTLPSLSSKSLNFPAHFIAALLLIFFFVLNFLHMRHQSDTYDEEHHYRYAMKLLKNDPARVDPFDESKLPFSYFNALPRRVTEWLQWDPAVSITARFLRKSSVARLVTTLFSLVLGFYVYRWSSRLYGPAAGVFSLFLYVFSPNILAHSHLITSDLYAALMITLSLYTFWKFLNEGGWKRALVSAVMLGLCQLSKYTGLLLYPVFLLIALARAVAGGWRPGYFISFCKWTLFFGLVSVLVINAGFFFNGTLLPWGDFHFKSSLLASLQSASQALGMIRVPVPHAYLDGLDQVLHRERTGEYTWSVYLLGKLAEEGHGFPGYFFYAYFFKETIAAQIFLCWAAGVYLRRRKEFQFMKNEAFLVMPVLLFLIYFNFFFNTQTGVRFMLMIFPLLYVFCGSLFKEFGPMSRKRAAVIVCLTGYLMISTLSYYPHFLSYFNEWVWDRKKAYKILADSNIDWHQSRLYLKKYKKEHPEAVFGPANRVSGTIVVSANSLVGVNNDDALAWLRENFEPKDHIAYTYLVYEVSPDDLERIRKGKNV
ncbi:MAG: glycosyltransferase family 39 protein [Candidatus Omnitrophota bacterium]